MMLLRHTAHRGQNHLQQYGTGRSRGQVVADAIREAGVHLRRHEGVDGLAVPEKEIDAASRSDALERRQSLDELLPGRRVAADLPVQAVHELVDVGLGLGAPLAAHHRLVAGGQRAFDSQEQVARRHVPVLDRHQ
jgi:hypothetical protein